MRVELPNDTPLTSVCMKPLPGWTAVVERGALPSPVERDGATITEAPTAVVWTAQSGAEVGPGQYQELAISVGPLPEAGTELILPATQTYSDGEEVAWAEAPLPDGSEPELPAPVLVTTAATAEEDHHGATAQPAADEDDDVEAGSSSGTASDDDDAEDSAPRWLGVGGLGLGAAALVVSMVRRPSCGSAHH